MNARAPKLLPLLAVAICGVLALKAVAGLAGAPAFLRQARAMAETDAPKAKAAKAGAKAEAGSKTTAPGGNAGAAPLSALPGGEQAPAAADAATPAVATRGTPICAPSAADLAKEAGLSPAELRVLQSLQSRRGELDDREQSLQTQVALISAAETKVDAKLKALADLKAEIQVMLGQADQKQQAEVGRLVTVYSAMKPDQAAAIMAQLDDRVRIPVAGQMKERALAAILAKMAPLEAKKITEKLASRYAPAEALTQRIAATETPATAETASAASPSAKPKPVRRTHKPVVKAAAKGAEAKAQVKPIGPATQPPAAATKAASTPAAAAPPSKTS